MFCSYVCPSVVRKKTYFNHLSKRPVQFCPRLTVSTATFAGLKWRMEARGGGLEGPSQTSSRVWTPSLSRQTAGGKQTAWGRTTSPESHKNRSTVQKHRPLRLSHLFIYSSFSSLIWAHLKAGWRTFVFVLHKFKSPKLRFPGALLRNSPAAPM